MTTRVTVKPELLTWAVERSGGWDLLSKTWVSTIKLWIDGTRKPTLRQLESFARATHTPFASLFLEAPPVEDIPIPDFRTLPSVTSRKPSANLLDTIYLAQRRQDWYRAYAHENESPLVATVGSVTLDQPVDSVAALVRQGLDFMVDNRRRFSNPVEVRKHLIEKLEDQGVLVMISGIVGANTSRPLNVEEFRGFALADSHAPLIFINAVDSYRAQIFSLLHEYAHLLLGGSALSNASPIISSDQEVERWCNQVTAEVLVPHESLTKALTHDLDDATLRRLSGLYWASTLTIVQRIYELGYCNLDEYNFLFEQQLKHAMEKLSKKPKSSGGNFYNTETLRVGRSFATALISDTYEGRTPFREAFELLSTRQRKTFDKFAEHLGVR